MHNIALLDIILVLLIAAIGGILIGNIINFFKRKAVQAGFSWSILMLGLALSIVLSLFVPGGIFLFGLFFFVARKG